MHTRELLKHHTRRSRLELEGCNLVTLLAAYSRDRRFHRKVELDLALVEIALYEETLKFFL